jgi:hypothetical protein
VGKLPMSMTAVRNEAENLLAMAIIGHKLIYDLFSFIACIGISLAIATIFHIARRRKSDED